MKRINNLAKKIMKYRAQGMSGNEIARKLHVSRSTVEHTVGKLVRQGVLEKATPGSKRDPNSKLMKICDLVNQGLSRHEISKIVGIPHNQIGSRIGELRRRGLLPLSEKSNIVPEEEWQRRIDLILPLLKNGLMDNEIAEKTGLTKAVVTGVVQRIYETGMFSHEQRFAAKRQRRKPRSMPLLIERLKRKIYSEKMAG